MGQKYKHKIKSPVKGESQQKLCKRTPPVEMAVTTTIGVVQDSAPAGAVATETAAN